MAFSRRKGRVLRLRRPSIGTAARVGLRYAVNRMQTRTRTTRPNSTPPLTYDNDFKTDYRYRRMPRRKRRRWVKFNRRVNYVTLRQQQGKKRVILARTYRHGTAADKTACTEMMLYSADGDVPATFSDMRTIIGQMLGIINWDDALSTGVLNAQKKITFESAQLEITARNVGLNKVIMEVYYVQCRNPQPNLNGYSSTPCGLYKLGFDKQDPVKDEETGNYIGVPMLEDEVGTGPFQSPQFCRAFKIISRRKYVIAPGNMVSWLLKDPKNRTIRVADCVGRMANRHTHGYFIQTYGEPGIEGETTIQARDTLVVFSQQRKYTFYAPVSNQNQASSA